MKLKKGQMQNFRDYTDVLYLSDPTAVHYTEFLFVLVMFWNFN